MDQVLDGKTEVKPVPFDAHDKVVRSSEGYKHQQFPKAVSHDKETGEPVVARDAKHEAELLQAAKKSEAKEK